MLYNKQVTVRAMAKNNFLQACPVCMGNASHLDDNIILSSGEFTFSSCFHWNHYRYNLIVSRRLASFVHISPAYL